MSVGLSARSALLLALRLSPPPFVPRYPGLRRDLPSGFQETVVLTGLTEPTALRFSPDGRVFVDREGRSGQGLRQPERPVRRRCTQTSGRKCTATTTAACSGMLLDPNFPTVPDIFVSYAHDAAIGGTAPRWGTPGRQLRSVPDAAGAHPRRLRHQRPPVAGSRPHRAGGGRIGTRSSPTRPPGTGGSARRGGRLRPMRAATAVPARTSTRPRSVRPARSRATRTPLSDSTGRASTCPSRTRRP